LTATGIALRHFVAPELDHHQLVLRGRQTSFGVFDGRGSVRFLGYLIYWQDGATAVFLVEGDQGGSLVELVPDLGDLGFERRLPFAVIGDVAGDEFLDETLLGLGTEFAMRDDHGRAPFSL
jgi:hypothetical protein